MNIIDANGDYQFQQGTRLLASSNHPVYRARIEISLNKGTWLYAPAAGHNLSRFKRAKQTPAKIDEFRKELAHYLSGYSPDVTDALVERNGVAMDLTIAEGVL